MTYELTPARMDAAVQDAVRTLGHGPVFELHLFGDGGPEWGVTGWSEEGGAVPDAPGLYAVYAKDVSRVRRELGPEVPVGADGLLYVGKAERSLAARDVRQHFGTGKTGRSTVRRTFAALLEHSALLWPVPRAGGKPSSKSPATFDLSERSEEALTRWMVDHLVLRVWVPEVPVALGDVEKHVITAWRPPLNLTHAGPPPPHQGSSSLDGRTGRCAGRSRRGATPGKLGADDGRGSAPRAPRAVRAPRVRRPVDRTPGAVRA
ncbi:hypothetical protein D8M15_00820 [Micrococcus sp. HSID17228]|nr:hypothetical protein D8M29_01285 [Micrococcus sp. HSID17227]RUQ45953.1 hypothetical protein D8M15_00820 [Micrococcus sp. HSID17228]